MALGAMQAIREMGLAAGRDVGVVGCDDIEEAAFSYPKLTSLRLNAHEIGSNSLQLLRKNLKSSGKPRETVLLAPELIVRGSTSRIESTRTPQRSI
jgi:LacI family transcriptional regulator, galactose operon repressor